LREFISSVHTPPCCVRLYRRQGRYDEAEPLYRRSLALIEKALGPERPDVGTLNNLAGFRRYV
jgi:Tetratricopeptide repeat